MIGFLFWLLAVHGGIIPIPAEPEYVEERTTIDVPYMEEQE